MFERAELWGANTANFDLQTANNVFVNHHVCFICYVSSKLSINVSSCFMVFMVLSEIVSLQHTDYIQER